MLTLFTVFFFLLAAGYIYLFRFKQIEKFNAFFAFSLPTHQKVEAAIYAATVHETELTLKGSAQDKTDELTMEIEDLEWLLEKKRTELDDIRMQNRLSEMAAARLNIIEESVNSIESRLAASQRQLHALKNFAMQVDELELGFQQIKNELAQSQYNYQDALSEVESLKEQLDISDEEVITLRKENQQLKKKVIILESLNQDLQSMVDGLKASRG